MKTLYDYQIFLRQKYGGISRYFFEIISNNLNKSEIYLFAGKYINLYDLEQFKNNCKSYYGNKIPFLPKSKLPNLFFNKLLFKSYLKKTRTDIYHPTYYDNIDLKTKAKKIITVHDMTHEKYPGNFSKLDNTIKLKKNSVMNADGIICISNSTKKDLLELYSIPEEKIKVIYHGNSLKYNVTEKPIFKNPYILYVGDRRAYKNFKIVLQVFRNSSFIKNNFSLLCFGGGKFKDKEKSLINEIGLKEKVFQTEGSDKDLANAYKYAVAFIYPSLYEGFGIPLLEAMHYGCPIIASNTSCFPEIAGDAALFFDPKNPEDLLVQIEKIINDPDIKKNLTEKGYEREKIFSWEKCANETLEFYKTVAEN